jgi:hypothetical protein
MYLMLGVISEGRIKVDWMKREPQKDSLGSGQSTFQQWDTV